MKKSINNKAVIAPLPVLIVCTYDEKGAVDYNKLQPISFDSETNSYRIIGEKVGKAFYDGKDYPKK